MGCWCEQYSADARWVNLYMCHVGFVCFTQQPAAYTNTHSTNLNAARGFEYDRVTFPCPLADSQTPKQQTGEALVLMSWCDSALSALCVCFKPLFLFQSQNWSQCKQIRNLSPLPSTLLHRVQHLRTPCCDMFLTQWGPLQLQAHWRWTEQVHKDGSFYFDVIWPILQCFA